MALKMTGVTKEELASLAAEIRLQPAFEEQSCYIASGADHEILAVCQPDGLFDVQLLDKNEAAVSVNETIREFQRFVSERSAATTGTAG